MRRDEGNFCLNWMFSGQNSPKEILVTLILVLIIGGVRLTIYRDIDWVRL
jgi:hypothetical protein